MACKQEHVTWKYSLLPCINLRVVIGCSHRASYFSHACMHLREAENETIHPRSTHSVPSTRGKGVLRGSIFTCIHLAHEYRQTKRSVLLCFKGTDQITQAGKQHEAGVKHSRSCYRGVCFDANTESKHSVYDSKWAGHWQGDLARLAHGRLGATICAFDLRHGGLVEFGTDGGTASPVLDSTLSTFRSFHGIKQTCALSEEKYVNDCAAAVLTQRAE